MDAERTYDEREADSRAAVQTALSAYFAVQSLEARSTAYLYAVGLPTFVLSLSAWHPLPDLVNWFAVLGWAFCVFATLALAAVAAKRRAQLAQVLPEANRIVHIQFASGDEPLPRSSTILIWLATVASALLWVNALVPHALRADVVEVSCKTWVILFAGAVANRHFEAS